MENCDDKKIVRTDIESKLAEHVHKIEKFDKCVQDINSCFQTLKDIHKLYNESRRLDLQSKKYDVEMTKIVADFKKVQGLAMLVFGERCQALEKLYETLDYGLANDNINIISEAVHGIGNIVATSPLKDISEFVKTYEDPSKPLLNF